MSDLAEAIRRFDLGEPLDAPVAVAEAWSNDVFRVTTNRGAYAVKLLPTNMPPSHRQRLLDAAAFEQRSLEAGVAVPTPMLSGDGAILADFLVATGIRTARCHHWVAGTPASQLVGIGGLAASAGHVLGQLHAIQAPGGDTSQLDEPDQDRWDHAVMACEVAGLPWAAEMAALTPTVRQLAGQIRELRRQRRPMQLSHRDFDPKNAVVDETGQLVTTDWDFAGPVVPGVELVTAGASFAKTDDQLGEFAQAYRRAGGNAVPADDLELSIEGADLDWILRNVEAVIRGRLDPTAEKFQTASQLIRTFTADISDLQSRSQRLRLMLNQCPM